jgi:hypothetical protein
MPTSRQNNPYTRKERHCDASSQGEKMALTSSDSNILAKEEIELYNKMKARIIKEKAFSEFNKSRIIEIPVEMELYRDEPCIEIQTFLHNYRNSEAQTEQGLTLDIITLTNKQIHAERFKITPAYEPLAIEVHKQLISSI